MMNAEQEKRYFDGWREGRRNPKAELDLTDQPYTLGVVAGKLSMGWDKPRG